jgi:hypothetical protein
MSNNQTNNSEKITTEIRDIKEKKIRAKPVNGRCFFLTFSQCIDQYWSREYILQKLTNEEEYLSRYLIAQEPHIDGTPHYHIFLEYSNKRCFSVNHFDYIGKHPCIEVPRSRPYVIDYCVKQDISLLANFDYNSILLKSGSTYLNSILTRYIRQGKSYSQIFFANELMSMKYHSQIKRFLNQREEQLLMDQREAKIIRSMSFKEIPIPEGDIFNREQNLILRKVNQILTQRSNRPHKSKHLYLSGPPNYGKTSLNILLGQFLVYFTFPHDGWFKGYQSGVNSFIAWDEVTFIGYKTTFLNLFFEGISILLAVKTKQKLKKDNPMTIMTSNNNLEQNIKQKHNQKTNCKQRYLQSDKPPVLYSFCQHCKKGWNCNEISIEISEKGRRVTEQLKARIDEVILTRPLFKLLDYIKTQFNQQLDLFNKKKDTS